jgi:hypothetical protein
MQPLFRCTHGSEIEIDISVFRLICTVMVAEFVEHHPDLFSCIHLLYEGLLSSRYGVNVFAG